MISDYFTKYCSYYLSRYSITEKKFENILKRKIKKDFFNKKFNKNDYFQYLNEIEKVLLYYKNIGFFKEESLIDGKIDRYIRKGYSKKKIFHYLIKDQFEQDLLTKKISEINNDTDLEFILIENFLKKKSLFNFKEKNLPRKDYFDKILIKLLKQFLMLIFVKSFLKLRTYGIFESRNKFFKNKF